MNRPEKLNAMTPQMHEEMISALGDLAVAPEAKVLVLTGAGESWSAGQDIDLFFRDLDDKPSRSAARSSRARSGAGTSSPTFPSRHRHGERLLLGAAFTPLVACDFCDRAEDAKFGLSGDQLGILPGGLVSKVMLVRVQLPSTPVVRPHRRTLRREGSPKNPPHQLACARRS